MSYLAVESTDSFLHQAFDLLKSSAETKPASDGPPPFGQDLYVLCAELAFQVGNRISNKSGVLKKIWFCLCRKCN